MRQHAYASFNKAATAAWAAIVAGQPVIIGHRTNPETQPTDCLRVSWLTLGSPSLAPGHVDAVVQLDIFVGSDTGKQNVSAALAYADALDDALGVLQGQSMRAIAILDYGQSPAVEVGKMILYPDDVGWINVPDLTFRQTHLSRQVWLTWAMR